MPNLNVMSRESVGCRCFVDVSIVFQSASGFQTRVLISLKVLFVFVDYFILIVFHFVWHLSFTYERFICVIFDEINSSVHLNRMCENIVDGLNAIYWIPIQNYRMCVCSQVRNH